MTGGITLTKSGAQILMSNGTIGSDVVTARGTVFHVTTGTINGDIQIGQLPSEDVEPLEVEPQIASSDSFLKQQTTGSVILPRRGSVLSLGTMDVDDGGAAVLDLTGADGVVINGDVTLAPDSIMRLTLDTSESLTPTVINGTTTWGQSELEVVLNGKLVADESFLLFETNELQGTTEDITKVTFRNAGGGVFFETSNVGDYITVENDGGMVQVYVNIDSASIPEPGTWVLLSLGLLGLAWMRRSRKCG